MACPIHKQKNSHTHTHTNYTPHTCVIYLHRTHCKPRGKLCIPKWLLVWDSAYTQYRNIYDIKAIPVSVHIIHIHIHIHIRTYNIYIVLYIFLLLYTTWLIDLFLCIINLIYSDNAVGTYIIIVAYYTYNTKKVVCNIIVIIQGEHHHYKRAF